MNRYTLPDGAEVTANNGIRPALNNHLWVNHPTMGLVSVNKELLTEVKPPPPPPEPPNGYIGMISDVSGVNVWLRTVRDDPWTSEQWWGTGFEGPHTWADVCACTDVTKLVALIPDPAAEVLELPWKLTESGPHVFATVGKVDSEGGGYVKADCRMNPREMHQMAAALLRAAREAANG